MITFQNNPTNTLVSDGDFTVTHYRELCQLALRSYQPAAYDAVPWTKRFVLWRHDLDLSLNRGLALANIERDVGLKATYFINPHSEFYNIAEAAQHRVVSEILMLGHDLGLHFDAAFYGDISEIDLNRFISHEADYLESLFGRKPVAFSFHNPSGVHLGFDAEHYGGLLNCYSKRFKSEVAYCSDSNGYWRFRRLHDVLLEAKDPCLQVLTHPGWWQEKPMPPRQRVFRSVYGRGAATLRAYDAWLEQNCRLNHSGAAASLTVLRNAPPRCYELSDYLWNQGEFETLFLELWRLHEAQINRLCNAQLCKQWRVPAAEVNAFFGEDGLRMDGWKLFATVFEVSWSQIVRIETVDCRHWMKTRNQIIHGRSSVSPEKVEEGCVALCGLIQRLAEWGKEQPVAYDGLADIESTVLPAVKTADGRSEGRLEEANIKDAPRKKWEQFKASVLMSDKND